MIDFFIIGKFYCRLSQYYQDNDPSKSIECLDKAVELSKSSDHTPQYMLLTHLADTKWTMGDYVHGKIYACEAQRVAKLSANLYNEADALCLQTGNLPRLKLALPREQISLDRLETSQDYC